MSPLFLIVGILIKFSSDGPILFWQERIGLNKRRFLIVKFRTMVTNAEQMLAKLESQNEVSGQFSKLGKTANHTYREDPAANQH